MVYWMSRERRVMDNWALAHGLAVAARTDRAFHVLYVLDHEKADAAGARHRLFEIRGLREVRDTLNDLDVPFHLADANGSSETLERKKETDVRSVLRAVEKLAPSLLVTDFSPLRESRNARDSVSLLLCPCDIPMHEVDARNVVPAWIATDKREHAARTLRKKITSRLIDFLTEFPDREAIRASAFRSSVSRSITGDALVVGADRPGGGSRAPETVDWEALLLRARNAGGAPEVLSKQRAVSPGETAASERLRAFCDRLHLYASRNDPNVVDAQSGLSPYLRYGQISAQRCVLEAERARKNAASADPLADPLAEAAASFVEELVVRRELAENFCMHTPEYDTLAGTASGWARESLDLHASDPREPAYTFEELESAATRDELWNAAQRELVFAGKMHGFMRMYWAKKILEWTKEGPHVAFDVCLRLNDSYSLDGRDSNGFVGVAWSVAGVHDQGWKERPVFGKIRYMNYAGCERKFNVPEYVARIEEEVRAETLARLGMNET